MAFTINVLPVGVTASFEIAGSHAEKIILSTTNGIVTTYQIA